MTLKCYILSVGSADLSPQIENLLDPVELNSGVEFKPFCIATGMPLPKSEEFKLLKQDGTVLRVGSWLIASYYFWCLYWLYLSIQLMHTMLFKHNVKFQYSEIPHELEHIWNYGIDHCRPFLLISLNSRWVPKLWESVMGIFLNAHIFWALYVFCHFSLP